MGETKELAAFIADLGIEDLSEEAIHYAKLAIIDTVGVATFGSSLPWSQMVAEVGRTIGNGGLCSVWGADWNATPSAAALVNGTAAHAVEMDDRHHSLNIHNGGATVPAAIALAEHVGASGRDLVLAVACGYEVAFRVARATHKRISDFYWVSIRNVWGAAAASAKILGLDAGKTTNTFGIVGSMASGLWEFKDDPYGTMSKRVQGGGWPAQSGVIAALMAQQGLTGPGSILEGKHGLRTFCHSDLDLPALVAGFGETFEMVNFETKAYATVGSFGTVVEASVKLRDEHGVKIENVRRIQVGSRQENIWHALKGIPESILAAQNHLGFVAAASLVYDLRDPSIWDANILTDSRITGLLEHCEMFVDEEIEALSAESGSDGGSRVTMEMENGETVSCWVKFAKGNPGNLMTKSDIEGKFRLLVGKVRSGESTGRLHAYLDGLDQDTSPVDLTPLLREQAR